MSPYDDCDPEPDDEGFDELACGSSRHGQCDLIGTEYCDWSCPLRDEVFKKRGHKSKPRDPD